MHFKIQPTAPGLSPRQQSYLARRLLCDLLASHYAITHLPDISVDANGKPFFPNLPGIHFSLSHCRIAVMAAIDSYEIGCDIEEIQSPFPHDIMSVAFSDEERKKILSAQNPEQELTALWTRKEAMVKRKGIIPDNPRSWPSDDPDILTRILPEANFAFSIACSQTNGNVVQPTKKWRFD